MLSVTKEATLAAHTRQEKPPWRHKKVVQAIIQWDIGTWRHCLDFWGKGTESFDGRLALEIGSHDGGLSLFLALGGCQVVCSDVAGPTDRARELHHAYGVDRLISYECVDARDIPFPEAHFDYVVLKSVLGALGAGEGTLGAQHEAISEIRRILKPGGKLLFAENTKGSPLHTILRARFVPWGKRWHYFEISEIEELMSEFESVEYSFRGFAATLGRREWQRSILHKLDRLLVPLLPRSQRYVVFGVATK